MNNDRPQSTPKRCLAQVEKRDTYRSSRGHGFKLHYTRCQCSRPAAAGVFCTQHAKIAFTRAVMEYRYAE